MNKVKGAICVFILIFSFGCKFYTFQNNLLKSLYQIHTTIYKQINQVHSIFLIDQYLYNLNYSLPNKIQNSISIFQNKNYKNSNTSINTSTAINTLPDTIRLCNISKNKIITLNSDLQLDEYNFVWQKLDTMSNRWDPIDDKNQDIETHKNRIIFRFLDNLNNTKYRAIFFNSKEQFMSNEMTLIVDSIEIYHNLHIELYPQKNQAIASINIKSTNKKESLMYFWEISKDNYIWEEIEDLASDFEINKDSLIIRNILKYNNYYFRVAINTPNCTTCYETTLSREIKLDKDYFSTKSVKKEVDICKYDNIKLATQYQTKSLNDSISIKWYQNNNKISKSKYVSQDTLSDSIKTKDILSNTTYTSKISDTFYSLNSPSIYVRVHSIDSLYFMNDTISLCDNDPLTIEIQSISSDSISFQWQIYNNNQWINTDLFNYITTKSNQLTINQIDYLKTENYLRVIASNSYCTKISSPILILKGEVQFIQQIKDTISICQNEPIELKGDTISNTKMALQWQKYNTYTLQWENTNSVDTLNTLTINHNDIGNYKYRLIAKLHDCIWASIPQNINILACNPLGKIEAYNDNIYLLENQSQEGNVLLNDIIDNENLILKTNVSKDINIIRYPQYGEIDFTNGDFIYYPQNNFIGNDSFAYEVCLSNNLCDTAQSFIHILSPENIFNKEPIVSKSITLETRRNSPILNYQITRDNSLINKLIEKYEIKVLQYPQYGKFVIDKDNYLYFEPHKGYLGTDQIIVQVSNKEHPSKQYNLQVDIIIKDQSNTLSVNDNYFVMKDSLRLTSNVNRNDYDAENNDKFYSIAVPPQYGTIDMEIDGSFVYSSYKLGSSKNDNFVYKVCDNGTPQLCKLANSSILNMNCNGYDLIFHNQKPICVDEKLEIYYTSNDSIVVFKDPKLKHLLNGKIISKGRWISNNRINQSGTVYIKQFNDECESEIKEYHYQVVYCKDDLTPVNFISPNGDGKNDKWIIKGIEDYPQNRVIIVNRWAEKVSEITNYNNQNQAWKGIDKHNRRVPNGTYYYKIIYDNKMKQGWIYVNG